MAHSAEPDELRRDVREPWGIIPDVSHVIHLAAEFGRCNGNAFPQQMWTTATLGTHYATLFCKMIGAKLIFASSSEAYGSLADRFNPLQEDLLEQHVPHFLNEYSLSKWCNEQQIRMRFQDYLILRLFNVYGPSEPKHEYRSFISRLCAGEDLPVFAGERSWLYISDFVEAVCLLLAKDASGVYNVGSPFSFSNHGVAGMIRGEDVEVLETAETHNVHTKIPGISKLLSLGWSPKVSLVEGIAECLSVSSCPTGTVACS